MGEDPAESFSVHESALRQSSPFFRAAFDKKWKEGQERHFELPEDDHLVFAKYAAWLYHGKLDMRFPEEDLSEEDFHSKSVEVESFLADCYIFGMKILDLKFCNTVIYGFIDSAKSYGRSHKSGRKPKNMTIGVTNYLYEHTAPGAAIRKFLVDIWVLESHDGSNLDDEKELHSDFSRDLLKVLLNQPKKGDYAGLDSLPRYFSLQDV